MYRVNKTRCVYTDYRLQFFIDTVYCIILYIIDKKKKNFKWTLNTFISESDVECVEFYLLLLLLGTYRRAYAILMHYSIIHCSLKVEIIYNVSIYTFDNLYECPTWLHIYIYRINACKWAFRSPKLGPFLHYIYNIVNICKCKHRYNGVLIWYWKKSSDWNRWFLIDIVLEWLADIIIIVRYSFTNPTA